MRKTATVSLVAALLLVFIKMQSSSNQGAIDLYANETELEYIYNQWIECLRSGDCPEEDRLDQEFSKKLTQVIVADTNSFSHPFNNLCSKGIISTWQSDDGKLKIYNWDRFSLESMRRFYTVYQFRHGPKNEVIFARKNNATGEIATTYDKVSALYTVKTDDATVYLMVRNTLLSSNDITQDIEGMTITAEGLKRSIPVFKFGTKVVGNISFNFLRSSVDNTQSEQEDTPDPFNLIIYDPKVKEILIPVVNQNMEVKKAYLVYQLKGNHFEYTGVKRQ